MNGIIGFSSILADNSLGKEDKESYVKIVNSSCQQLLHIINDIIDISKIEAGQIDIEESPFIFRDLLDEVLAFFSPMADASGIVLKREPVPEQVAEIIKSDRTKIRQVLDNLYSNALKFTPSGSITLKCSLENDFLIFRVSDTGVGIEPEVHEVIFERFRQADTNFSRTHEGTGLGLSISKAYVEKMGGAIGVDSEKGKGASFWFSVPYKPARILTPVNDSPMKNSGKDRIFTVLVVEDEEINWMYTYEVLKDRINVIRAKTGSEALEIIKGDITIDLVLMDIKLPDINGLELTKMFRKLKNDLPVIALTAYALSGDREKAINAGCSEYLSKPVKREDLLDVVLAYCR